MAGPKPITRQRSPWQLVHDIPIAPGWTAKAHVRKVHDGALRAFVAEEPAGWVGSDRHDNARDCRKHGCDCFLAHMRASGHHRIELEATDAG